MIKDLLVMIAMVSFALLGVETITMIVTKHKLSDRFLAALSILWGLMILVMLIILKGMKIL